MAQHLSHLQFVPRDGKSIMQGHSIDEERLLSAVMDIRSAVAQTIGVLDQKTPVIDHLLITLLAQMERERYLLEQRQEPRVDGPPIESPESDDSSSAADTTVTPSRAEDKPDALRILRPHVERLRKALDEPMNDAPFDLLTIVESLIHATTRIESLQEAASGRTPHPDTRLPSVQPAISAMPGDGMGDGEQSDSAILRSAAGPNQKPASHAHLRRGLAICTLLSIVLVTAHIVSPLYGTDDSPPDQPAKVASSPQPVEVQPDVPPAFRPVAQASTLPTTFPTSFPTSIPTSLIPIPLPTWSPSIDSTSSPQASGSTPGRKAVAGSPKHPGGGAK
jgi:hypothetical protein